jgi:ferrous iron transport protein B
MPSYHLPIWRNIFFTTWHRLKGFLLRAGKTIVIVVTILSFVNSIGTDGSFGNENSDKSVLSLVGKTLTPLFSPLGVEEENWPATVGIFTGMFAKEAIVGTLDALYIQETGDSESFNLLSSMKEAVVSIKDNFIDMLGSWSDPLGLSSATDSVESQGVHQQTLTHMASLFHGQWGAFCYLVLILLYTPCVAVLGAINREAGAEWMWVVIGWTSLLSYGIATILYQLANITQQPLFSSIWIAGVIVCIAIFIRFLKRTGRRIQANLIKTVTIE